MGKDLVNLEVDKNVITTIVEKQIQTAIVANLGGQEELIEKLVRLALHEKVDENCKVNCTGYLNRYDFLERLASNSIRDAAKAALSNWLANNQQKIKDAVLKELKKPARQASIAKAYLSAIEDSLRCTWRMDCKIIFKDVSD